MTSTCTLNNEVWQKYNINEDDLSLVKLVVNAAIMQSAKLSHTRVNFVLRYVKHQLDQTLRPAHNGTKGEWNTLMINGLLLDGILSCGIYTAIYIPVWDSMLIAFYA